MSTDVWAVIRYARGGHPALVAIYTTFDAAKDYIHRSEEADEHDFDIEQHTLDQPERSAP